MRLTNPIRKKIADALIDHAFRNRLQDIDRRKHDLALLLYRTRVPKSIERQIEKLDEAARKVGIASSFCATVQGVVVKRLGESKYRLPLTHRRPWTCSYNHPEIVMEEEHQYREEYDALRADESLIEEQSTEARLQIMATLGKINTEKQFREHWPEALPIAKQFLKHAASANVPAIPTADLNEKLSLQAEPSKAKAAS